MNRWNHLASGSAGRFGDTRSATAAAVEPEQGSAAAGGTRPVTASATQPTASAMPPATGATPPASGATPPAAGAASPPIAGAAPPNAGDPSDAGVTPPDGRYQQELGERLRAVRRAQGMRLQDVETRSNGRFKAVVVGSYERGDRAVSAHKLAALAAFYGVPVTDLLPSDGWPRGGAERDDTVRLAVGRLRNAPSSELVPLVRLVQHVQWLRGDYNGQVLSLRRDDLRTVAVALGVPPDGLPAWLEERGLLLDS